MSLNLFVDTLESVPENQRALYVKKDGKFALDVADLDSYVKSRGDGVYRALQAERENNKEIKKLGRAPSEIAAILADVESAASSSAIFKTMLAQHETKAAADRAILENENKTVRDHEQSVIRELLLVTGLKNASANDEGVKGLSKLLENRFRVDAIGNKRSVVILDEAGAPMEIEEKNGTKRAANFNDLFAEAIAGYPSWFEGTGAGGGAPTRQSVPSSKTITRAAFNVMSSTERAEKMQSGWTIHN